MPERPSETITFLFSDIEGSTQRWEQQRELMRPAIAAQAGCAYKMVGDAFQVAFATAPAALLFARRKDQTYALVNGNTDPLEVGQHLYGDT